MAQQKANIKPQTPGQAPPAKQMPPQEAKKTDEQKAAEAEADQRPGNTSVITPELQDIIDAEVKKRVAAEIKARAGDTDFPDQSDIDPKKITRAQMSAQGWVCPAPPDRSIAELEQLKRIM